MNLQKLVSEIIPLPPNRENREGFSNTHLIDQLNQYEREQVENALIDKLSNHADKSDIDILVVETLAYMKSEKSLLVLYNLLKKASDNMEKLAIAVFIFEIKKDQRLIDIGIEAFKQISNKSSIYAKYSIVSGIHYLKQFEDSKTNNLIREYANHRDYLISYNAKQALGM